MKRVAFLLSLLFLFHFTTLSSGATKPKVLDAYGKLPLSFEANQGQSDDQVKFLSRGDGYTLCLTSTDVVLFLRKGTPSGGGRQHAGLRTDEPVPPRNLNRGDDVSTKSAVLRIRLVGASPAPQLTGFNELPGKSNYFIGNDPKKWRRNVPTYGKVKYHAVYPGVDVVYYGNERQLEHDFIVAPGADPSVISLRIEGAEKLSVDAHGDLILSTPNGEVRFRKPVVYQELDGVRREIAGRYSLRGKQRHQVGFEVAAYDVTKPLVIDPVLAYSTYLGPGTGQGIALDSAGNAYVTGTAGSRPTTPGAFQTTSSGGLDAFVAKLSADGSSLVYSTYLGGDGNDYPFGIAVDSTGNAYVTGSTDGGFPTTSGAAQTTYGGGGGDIFATKLSADGSSLVYSTYLGGSGDDDVPLPGSGASLLGGIAVDSAGNAYVTGWTTGNFPTTPGAFQTTFGGGTGQYPQDAVITKLSADGSMLVYSTYLGGSDGNESGTSIAVDSAGNAYVTGLGASSDFPTTPGAFQTARGGGYHGFVTKLSADGSSLVYSTYLGSFQGKGIVVDSAGSAYVTGAAGGPGGPTTAGAYQPTSRRSGSSGDISAAARRRTPLLRS